MFPPQFLAEYPLTAAAISQMVRQDSSAQGEKNQNAIKAELLERSPDTLTAEALFAAIWAEVKGSRAEFAVRTSAAFRYLGVCDEVRLLIGSVWAAAFRQWDSIEQLEFLRLLFSQREVHWDLALEFLPGAIPDLKLTAHEFWSWISDSRRGGAKYPHRLPIILQAYAETKLKDALLLAELFLERPSDADAARFAALLAHWVREKHPTGDGPAFLKNLTTKLASGPVEYRCILVESWAFSAANAALDESKVAHLKQLMRRTAEELKAWCFLLQQIVMSSPKKWSWVMPELRAIERGSLLADQKFLLLTTALHGWLNTDLQSPIPRLEWEALIRSLTPIKADEKPAWDHLEHFFVDAFERDSSGSVALVALIAETSGSDWSKVMDENRNEFNWWCQTLKTSGNAEAVLAKLCFSEFRAARRVGLHIARKCGVGGFGNTTIPYLTPKQIERLLLEATLTLGEYGFIGRIHLAFAPRVDQIGGELAEWFYDETLIQALNTNQYRETILKNAASTSKLRVIGVEAERQIDASAKASKSPALQMRIPGFSRAASLSMRRFGRDVAKGIEKYSDFARLFPTIRLLYGKSWQLPDATGALSAATPLSKIEHSIEMPRLEFMTPEAMRLRRLTAVRRIVELDREVEDE